MKPEMLVATEKSYLGLILQCKVESDITIVAMEITISRERNDIFCSQGSNSSDKL
jgi:hypothetical protein